MVVHSKIRLSPCYTEAWNQGEVTVLYQLGFVSLSFGARTSPLGVNNNNNNNMKLLLFDWDVVRIET